MTLLDRVLFRFVLPFGLLFSLAYGVEDIRTAVEDYIPEVALPAWGVFLFFVFGANIGLFLGLLATPEAIPESRGSQKELHAAIGFTGARAVRSFAVMSLLFFCLAMYAIIRKAYG